jgi:hypothetical protein
MQHAVSGKIELLSQLHHADGEGLIRLSRFCRQYLAISFVALCSQS